MSDADPFAFLDRPAAAAQSNAVGVGDDPFAFLDRSPSESKDRLEPIANYDGTDAIVHGMTLGMSEPVAALFTAGRRYLSGDSPDFDYSQAYRERQRGRQIYEENNPLANALNNVGGGALSGGLALPRAAATAAPSVVGTLGQIAKGSVLGAGMGGVMGASDNASSLGRAGSGALSGAELGGVVGAVVPAAVAVAPPAVRVARSLLNPSGTAADDAATSAIASRLSSDIRGGGPSLAQMTDRLNNAEVPLSLADVAGTNTRNLAGSLARSNSPASQVMENALTTRDRGMGDRLISVINRDISSAPSAFDATQALTAAQKANAAPLYDTAFASGPVYSDRLQGFLDNPRVQQGLKTGYTIERDNALAEGRPFAPNDYAIRFNEAGDPVFFETPNMRTLDTAKQGLDTMLEGYRNPITGELNLDPEGRAINNVRKAFLNELDNLNPDYAAARSAYAGPADVKDAIALGRSFTTKEPEQIQSLVSNFSPSQREGYLLGAAQTLRNQVSRTSDGGNEALRVGYSDFARRQLRPLFDSDAGFAAFMKPIDEERLGARTLALVPARPAGETTGGPTGVGRAVIGAVAGGNPAAGFGIAAARGLADLLSSHLAGQTPQAQTAAAHMLTTTNPAYRQMALDEIAGKFRPKGGYVSPLAGILAGVQASKTPALNLFVPTPE
jgi:hypothetical protein